MLPPARDVLSGSESGQTPITLLRGPGADVARRDHGWSGNGCAGRLQGGQGGRAPGFSSRAPLVLYKVQPLGARTRPAHHRAPHSCWPGRSSDARAPAPPSPPVPAGRRGAHPIRLAAAGSRGAARPSRDPGAPPCNPLPFPPSFFTVASLSLLSTSAVEELSSRLGVLLCRSTQEQL